MRSRWTALLSLCAGLLFHAARAAIPEGFTESVWQIEVNSSAASEMAIAIRDAQNNVWLEKETYERMRLRTPVGPAMTIDGVEYYRIQAIPGAQLLFDDAAQRLSLTVPPDAFTQTALALDERPPLEIARADPGGFVNYEFSAEHDRTQGTVDTDLTFGTGFAELGFFGPHGVVTHTALGQHSQEERRAVRLETTWTYDFPDKLQTLRVGDAIGSGSRWSRAARFGGVQWGSNFAVRPDLVTSPFLSAAGAAVVPSTVDVFVNNQQISSRQVPAGPFVIDRLPAISGAGDVRLVVRDAFGREQVITAPFYSSAVLLQKGLAQYSVEFGMMRENFGLESNDYGSMLASGTYRRGLTDALTLEAHGEVLKDGPRALGVDAALRIGTLGIVSATVAHGADETDSGVLTAVGFERSGRRFSINARSQFATDGFRQIGDSPLLERPQRSHALSASANLYRFGSLSLAYAVAEYQDQSARKVGTLTHSLSVPWGYVSLSLSRTLTEPDATSAFLIFTAPMGSARSVSASARYDKDPLREDREIIATFQQNPPLGSGLGYRVSASTEGNYAASVLRQFDPLAIEIEAAKYFNTSAVRATVNGGAVLLGGGLYATRAVHDSFALIDVAGIEDVEVMVDNQAVRRTDDQGHALIRNLRAYEVNRISVDPRYLPLDTRIDSDRMTITPRFRSGVIVRFPVQRERGGTFRLVQENGVPVPSGAEVLFKSNRFPVAMDGLVYVSGLDHGMAGEAEWRDSRCIFRVDAPASDDPMPDMGTIVCRAPE